jgi:2-polyprenyl-6-methoxyphenol hydroxylase-like FAD-dependent oxidoreductase
MNDVIIVGAGICGLTLALSLHQRNIPCRVFERAPRITDLGVGITLLPHAMRELASLGLDASAREAGIENRESRFFNRFGQLIYTEPRGRFAGYPLPEIGIHRGRLQMILHRAAVERLGADRIATDHQCVAVEQGDDAVTAHFRETSSGNVLPGARGAVVVACDGVNSTIRRQLHPADALVFAGINTWRGVTRRKPILDGRTYLRIGSIMTGKMVIYPIVDDVDGAGDQLVNWVAEIKQEGHDQNDWNKPGDIDAFLPIYEGWRFDWLDVPALIANAKEILEYPMVDKDPVPRWTFGRVSFLGDAAHPMYPRGSNGSAQALLDASTLARLLAEGGQPQQALQRYESLRLPATARVVETNRTVPPDFIIMKADELSGGQPFPGTIDDLVSQEALRKISDDYKKVAGFALQAAK